MKYLVMSLMLLAVGASAQDTTYGGATRSPEPAQKITVVKSSSSTSGIDISTFSPTSIVGDVAQMFSQVCVQNFSTSAFLACGENPVVSTQTASNQVGTILPAAASVSAPDAPTCFAVIPGYNFYCRNSWIVPTRAGVKRVR